MRFFFFCPNLSAPCCVDDAPQQSIETKLDKENFDLGCSFYFKAGSFETRFAFKVRFFFCWAYETESTVRGWFQQCERACFSSRHVFTKLDYACVVLCRSQFNFRIAKIMDFVNMLFNKVKDFIKSKVPGVSALGI
jgi:hypothetical protein